MKIAVTGAAGIGKTTLCRALAQEFSLTVIEEQFNDIMRAFSAWNFTKREKCPEKEVHAARQNYIDQSLLWMKNRREQQYQLDGFVTDRCAIDILQRFVLLEIGTGNSKWFEAMVREVQQQLNVLDLVIMPPLIQFNDAAVNDTGLRRQHSPLLLLRTQSLNRGLLEQLSSVPRLYLPIQARSIDDRIACVKAALKDRH